MTREDAELLFTGDTSVACPPAAIELAVGLTEGPTAEWRRRCRVALAALYMDQPLLPVREELDEIGAAVGAVLAHALRSGNRRERLRLVGLLQAVCREAEALGGERVAS